MKIPLEEYIPYRISALIVLVVFYGIYLVKQWRQKRRGIRTIQIGRRKDTQTHTVETLMGIATAGIIPAQLLSITFGWSHLPSNARFTGFCIGMVGDLIFLISVLCMKDSWRAGIPVNLLTGMFTVLAIVMLHLQILQEERYLTATFGTAYLDYRHRVFRYLGRRRGKKR